MDLRKTPQGVSIRDTYKKALADAKKIKNTKMVQEYEAKLYVPDYMPYFNKYLRIFHNLGRDVGMSGPMQIKNSELLAYTQLHDIKLSSDEVEIISTIDKIFLSCYYEAQPKNG